jgi:hypothetical protein
MHQARAYAAAHDAQHRRWDVTRGQSLDRFIGAIMRDQIVCYGFLLAVTITGIGLLTLAFG